MNICNSVTSVQVWNLKTFYHSRIEHHSSWQYIFSALICSPQHLSPWWNSPIKWFEYKPFCPKWSFYKIQRKNNEWDRTTNMDSDWIIHKESRFIIGLVRANPITNWWGLDKRKSNLNTVFWRSLSPQFFTCNSISMSPVEGYDG